MKARELINALCEEEGSVIAATPGDVETETGVYKGKQGEKSPGVPKKDDKEEAVKKAVKDSLIATMADKLLESPPLDETEEFGSKAQGEHGFGSRSAPKFGSKKFGSRKFGSRKFGSRKLGSKKCGSKFGSKFGSEKCD